MHSDFDRLTYLPCGIRRIPHRGYAVIEPLVIDTCGFQMGSHFNDGQ